MLAASAQLSAEWEKGSFNSFYSFYSFGGLQKIT